MTLRFGLIEGWEGEEDPLYTFSYKLLEKEGEFVEIEQMDATRNLQGQTQSELTGKYLGEIWRKIWE